jgi:hypothetical protein
MRIVMVNLAMVDRGMSILQIYAGKNRYRRNSRIIDQNWRRAKNARINTAKLRSAPRPSPAGKLIVGGFENSIFAAAWLLV